MSFAISSKHTVIALSACSDKIKKKSCAVSQWEIHVTAGLPDSACESSLHILFKVSSEADIPFHFNTPRQSDNLWTRAQMPKSVSSSSYLPPVPALFSQVIAHILTLSKEQQHASSEELFAFCGVMCLWQASWWTSSLFVKYDSNVTPSTLSAPPSPPLTNPPRCQTR